MEVAEEIEPSLQWLDYFVIGVVLLISALIGIFYRFSGGRQKTAKEYFSADHSMSVPMIATAMVVAFLSAIALLGSTGEIYTYGTQIVMMNIGFLIATPITAHLYLPVFYNLQNMSIYEYLEKRFGTTAALVASIANFFQMCLNMGIILYAPALALEAATGLSSTMSILLIGLICTFYSGVGGIKAVLATDVFQGILMLASVFCVIGVGCTDIEGGLSEIWDIAAKGDRLEFFNFDLDPTARLTFWSVIVGGIFIFVSEYGIGQIFMQRLLSAKNLSSAQLALYINAPMLSFMSLVLSFSGLVLYAWFVGCDPILSDQIVSVDQVMPYFAKIRLTKIPGLAGFFIAGIFSAGLSTLSALLNSLAAIAIADYIKPLYRQFGREFTDGKALFLGKILCAVNGIFCVAIAFLSSRLGTLLQAAYAIKGSVSGPVLGLFTLGLFVEAANEKGAVIGALLSLALSGWMSFGQPKPPIPELPVSIDKCFNSTLMNTTIYQLVDSETVDNTDYFYLYRISYMWYTPLGFATTMIFGYIASRVDRFFTKKIYEPPDAHLFTPLLADRIRQRREVASKVIRNPIYVVKNDEFL